MRATECLSETAAAKALCSRERGSGITGAPYSAQRLERVDPDASKREALARAASFAVRIEIAERVVEVRFDDASARDVFARRFRDHSSDRDYDLEYFVASDGGSLYFWSWYSQPWRWPDGVATPELTAFLADAAVVSAIVRSDSVLVSLHAAVVSRGGRIAAVGGDSWSGKSTTAIACVRQGMQFYSDERLLMRGRMVYPFQRACSLRAAGRKLLASDGVDDAFDTMLHERESDGDWQDLSIVDTFGRRAIGAPGPLAAIFVISGYGTLAEATRVNPVEALPALFRWMDAREGNFKRLARLVELLEPVPCFALRLGTPRESARAIAAKLESLDQNAA